MDDRQVTAVSARIELDLRLGAAFTRYQTLTLREMGGDLADRLISYGQSSTPFNFYVRRLIVVRFVSIPDPGLRCRSIFPSQEFCTGNVLEHQGRPAAGRHQSNFLLAAPSVVRPRICYYPLREMSGSKDCESLEDAEKADKQVEALAIDHC